MKQPDEILRILLEKLSRTEEEELDCKEVFQLMDQYAESVARGEEPSELFPLVARHLEICKDCREEFEALMRVIEAGLT
jgi:hypothetical protein